jgi:hypothetical protein
MNSTLLRCIARLLVVSMIVFSFPLGSAHAGMIGTETAQQADEMPALRARVQAFMERGDVQAQMQQLGVDGNAAKARAQSLTDAEVRQIAGKLDQLPAGAGADWLGVVLVIFVVLLITDLLGLTKIFPFIGSR